MFGTPEKLDSKEEIVVKKLSAILAVVAVIAIIFAVVFGVQKGNLQNDMKTAADQAAAKLAEVEGAAKTAADEAAAKLADAEAAAKTAADEAAAKLADAEAAAKTAADEAAAKLAEVEGAAKTAADEAAAKLADAEAAAKTAADEAAAALKNAQDEAAAKVSEVEAAAKAAADEAAAKLAEVEAAAKTAADEAAAKLAKVEGQLASVNRIAAPAFAEYYKDKIVILHSNDVHGAIDGYAYIAGLKNLLENLGAQVIMVDAGDFSQGTIYVSTNKGEKAIEMMNAAGYDVVTLGNHEFDFGYAQLMENLKKANFQTICANVILDETNEPMLPATATIEKGGVKIGFFGIETPETATKVNPGMISEIHFTTFGDLYIEAQKAIDDLEDADIVIGLTHLGVDVESAANGYRSIDLLKNTTGADFLIDAHSHTVMTEGENGEPIQSTGTAFEYVGVIVIDNEKKEIVDNYLLSTDMIEKDEAVAAKAKEIMDAIDADYGAVFAETTVRLNGDRDPGNRTEETNLGDLITDAMIWSVVDGKGIPEEMFKYTVGITNGGGIRASIEAGGISMKDINTVLPFGNTVTLILVKGSELLEALEASTFCTPKAIGGYPQTSGIVWTLDTTKPYDQGEIYKDASGKESSYYGPASINRVTIESINGIPFDPEMLYAVVTNNFCAAGGDTYNVFMRAFTDTENPGFDTGIPMDQAVMEYINNELDGKIGDKYAAPRGSETQIR